MLTLNVAAVHLDFSRASVRKREIAEMAAVLSDRTGPVIVLGDFNSDWSGDDSVVTELVHRCGMQVYQPMAADMGTYPSSGRRQERESLPGAPNDYRSVPLDTENRAAGVSPCHQQRGWGRHAEREYPG